MAEFIPGLQLSGMLYEEAVRPILAAEFPGLAHAAARLGGGSEVLGYDDLTSTDHDWGPRLQLFLGEGDHQHLAGAVREALSLRLPATIGGYYTHFGPPDDEGTRQMEDAAGGLIDHRVEIWTVHAFLADQLAYDPAQEPTVAQWLTFPQQLLLGITAGRVYADELGTLTAVRQRLAYYPRDVWLYLLAAQWARIGQEEAFVGRSGQTGDELGSRLIAARLVHDLMQLGFLMERCYAPYPKWFGTAFTHLACAPALGPVLQQVLEADSWQAREKPLCRAYEIVAGLHNGLGITEPLPTAVSRFHGRPFLVISADRFVAAIKAAICDERVKSIQTNIGGIDQYSYSTDLRTAPRLHKHLYGLYGEAAESLRMPPAGKEK